MAARLATALFPLRMLVALVQRPHLVSTALRQVRVMAPQRWWANPPFLPLPPADYLHFRQVTATGIADGPPDVHDTVVWLEWCRSMRKLPPR